MDNNKENHLADREKKGLLDLKSKLRRPLLKYEGYQLPKQGYVQERNHVTELHLQDMELETVPKIVNAFRNLEVLVLQNNKLHSFNPTLLKSYSQLKMLDLSQNNLKTINLEPIQECKRLRTLVLDKNQFQNIDLSPLQECKELSLLSLEQNQLRNISLDFLEPSSSLQTLVLRENPLENIDITPLLLLSDISLVSIDEGVQLTSNSIHRDYSVDFHWFTSEYLPHVTWYIPENDPPSQTLYPMYEKIVKNFRFEEFWPDYRDRRMLVPSAQSYEVRFFESAVEWYLSIKNRVRTDSSRELRNNKRQAIEYQHQDQFLGGPALITVLKGYFEFGYESEFSVQLFEGAIVIVRFWAYEGPSRSSLVQSISWIKIVVDDTHQSYQVTKGFNRGLLRFGKKYHPIPPPVDFPSDLHTSTEVMYEIDTFTTASLPDLLNRSRSWLKNFFFPKFDPDNPHILYGM